MSERSERMEIPSGALLACPFCGGEPGGVDGDDVARAVGCYCGANGPIHATAAEAIAAWNKQSTARERDLLTSVIAALILLPIDNPGKQLLEEAIKANTEVSGDDTTER